MRKSLVIVLAWVACFALQPAHAERPDCFRVLADHADLPLGADTRPPMRTFLSAWKPSADDTARGFAAGRVDLNVAPRPDWIWSEPVPQQSFDFFLSRGEYRCQAIAIRSLRPLKALSAAVQDLKSPDGKTIPAENIEIQKIKYLSIVDKNSKASTWRGSLLESFDAADVEADWTTWMWVSINVPGDAKVGVYQTQIMVSDAGGHQLALPVRLRVLDMDFSYPDGAWGAYLPGHFYRDADSGNFVNYAAPEWKPQNVQKYFEFWKTRGFNSPTLYHIYPQLSYVNGSVVSDYPEVRQIAQAMNAAKLEGPLGLDTRWIEWWSNAVAQKIQHQAGTSAGDLGISANQGITSANYPESSKPIYKQGVEQFLGLALKEAWPNPMFLAEEEIGFPSDKTAGYDFFMPVLRQVVGDRAFLIDDAIGYGIKDVVDRGARDQLLVRQYNNWTEEGLAAVHAVPGAVVRNYNMGWTRASFGLYDGRTGAVGNSQWAEQWFKPSLDQPLDWQTSVITDHGIVTSAEFERAHEGLCDLFYIRTLEKLAVNLEKSGRSDAANSARSVLRDIMADVPIERYEFFRWQENCSDDEFELRRWRVILEIEKANQIIGKVGASYTPLVSSGYPHIEATSAGTVQRQIATEKMLRAVRVDAELPMDFKSVASCWSTSINDTNDLWWIGSVESAMRAKAGSDEEFRRMPRPSGAHAQVAYGAKGLYFRFEVNHASANMGLVKYGDDSPDLWKDDCMEVFFEVPGTRSEAYHLTVNSAGKRALRRGANVVPSAIRVVTETPINPTGGYRQEVLIPWTDIGLTEMPALGTAWRMNVCRAFNSWLQLTSWSQVQVSFNEPSRWGTMIFDGPAGRVFITDLLMGSRGPGENVLSGQLVLADSADTPPAAIELVNAAGAVIASQKLKPVGDRRFAMKYTVPILEKPQTWSLRALTNNAEPLSNVPIPIPAFDRSVTFHKTPAFIIAGRPLVVDIQAAVGDYSVSKYPLAGEMVDAGGKRVSLSETPLAGGGLQHVWIDTCNLAPGTYDLRLKLRGLGASNADGVSLQVLPSPMN